MNKIAHIPPHHSAIQLAQEAITPALPADWGLMLTMIPTDDLLP